MGALKSLARGQRGCHQCTFFPIPVRRPLWTGLEPSSEAGYVGYLINTVEGATEDYLAFNCFLTFEPAENRFGARFLGDHLKGTMKELLCFYGHLGRTHGSPRTQSDS